MQIAGFAVCAAAMALVMHRLRPESAVVLVIAAGVLVLLMVMPQLKQIMTDLSALAQAGNLQGSYVSHLMKVGGISLLMDFAAQTCRDAQEEGLARKVELAGRVMLLSLALPVMRTLLAQIISLSPS